MNDITALIESLKEPAKQAIELGHIKNYAKGRHAVLLFQSRATPANVLALVDALEKAQSYIDRLREWNANLAYESCEYQKRIAELGPRTVTVPQSDYFASLVAMARVSADKAMRKFPQPNYVLLKVAEEAGEVVQAGVHYAEKRMEWEQVEGEIVQLLAMLIRLVTEGDQINGITPPAAGIQVIEGGE